MIKTALVHLTQTALVEKREEGGHCNRNKDGFGGRDIESRGFGNRGPTPAQKLFFWRPEFSSCLGSTMKNSKETVKRGKFLSKGEGEELMTFMINGVSNGLIYTTSEQQTFHS